MSLFSPSILQNIDSGLSKTVTSKVEKNKKREEKRKDLRSRIEKYVADVKKAGKAAGQNAAKNVSPQKGSEAPNGLLHRTCQTIMSEFERAQEPDDEHTLLCLAVAKRLRALPRHLSNAVSVQMLQLVCEAEATSFSLDDSDLTPVKVGIVFV